MANEILVSEAENEQFASVLAKGDRDLDSLSEGEHRQYYSHTYALINSLDAAHGFYIKGILDEADFLGWRNYICPYLSAQSVNVIWKTEKLTFGDDFVSFVENEGGFEK